MNELIHISYGMAGLVGLLGYAVVFFGLFLLMIVITVLGRIMMRRSGRKNSAPTDKVKEHSELSPCSVPAEGDVELYGVHPREAAIVMAIVADRLGKPLQELRFKSIKEVKNR